jgi:uncharacterized protein
MKKFSLILIGLVIFLFACSNNTESNSTSTSKGSTKDFSMATSSSGGTGYMYGVAVSTIVNNHLEGVKLTPVPSAGVIENDRLLREGSTDLIIHTGENASLSYKGEGPFDSSYELRAMWPMYASFINIVVPESSSIKSIKDLKGKRIGMGAPGSSANVTMTKLMEINGLTEGDYTPMPLGLDEQVSALKDGTIDAITIIIGFNTPSFVDLTNSRDVRWISVDDKSVEKLIQDSPVGAYVPLTMPSGSYKNQNEDIKTVGVPLWIVTNEDFDEKLTEDIVKVFFENFEEAKKIHAVVNDTNKELIEGSIPPVPWHPGAIKAFEALGYNLTPFNN